MLRLIWKEAFEIGYRRGIRCKSDRKLREFADYERQYYPLGTSDSRQSEWFSHGFEKGFRCGVRSKDTRNKWANFITKRMNATYPNDQLHWTKTYSNDRDLK